MVTKCYGPLSFRVAIGVSRRCCGPPTITAGIDAGDWRFPPCHTPSTVRGRQRLPTSWIILSLSPGRLAAFSFHFFPLSCLLFFLFPAPTCDGFAGCAAISQLLIGSASTVTCPQVPCTAQNCCIRMCCCCFRFFSAGLGYIAGCCRCRCYCC